MLGLPFKGKAGAFLGYDHENAHYCALNALLEAGLLIRIDGGGQAIGRYYPSIAVFADAQVLAAIAPLPPQSLDLQPLAPQGRAEFRAPARRGPAPSGGLHPSVAEPVGPLALSAQGVAGETGSGQARQGTRLERDAAGAGADAAAQCAWVLPVTFRSGGITGDGPGRAEL